MKSSVQERTRISLRRNVLLNLADGANRTAPKSQGTVDAVEFYPKEVQILLTSLYARNFRSFWEIGRLGDSRLSNWKIAKIHLISNVDFVNLCLDS
jgi:hypothetical protein